MVNNFSDKINKAEEINSIRYCLESKIRTGQKRMDADDKEDLTNAFKIMASEPEALVSAISELAKSSVIKGIKIGFGVASAVWILIILIGKFLI